MSFKLNLLLLMSVLSYAPIYSMVSHVPKEEMVQQLRDRTGAGMLDCQKALEEACGDLEAAVKILEKNGSLSNKVKKFALDVSNFVKNKPKYSAVFLYGLYKLKEASGKKYTLPLRLCSQALLTYNMYKNDKDTTLWRASCYASLCSIGVRHSVIKIDANGYSENFTVL